MVHLSGVRTAQRSYLETLPSLRTPHDTKAFVNTLVKQTNKFIGMFQPEQQERLARAMMYASAEPGTVLYGQGELGDTFYTILRGTVQIERRGAFCRLLEEGDFFGEQALFEVKTVDREYAATVVESAEFATLKRDAFNVAMSVDDSLVEKVALLTSIPVLAHCAVDYIVHLALMGEFITKEAGDFVCRQAAEVSELYIVESGQCLLEVKFDFLQSANRYQTHAHHLPLSVVAEGEMIGDIELINEVGSGYHYTARALTNCRLLTFKSLSFAEQMTTNVFEAMRLYCRMRSQWRNRRMTVQLGILARSGYFPAAERFCFEPEIPLSKFRLPSKLLPAKFERMPLCMLSASRLPNDLIEPLTARWDDDGVSRIRLRECADLVPHALKQGSNGATAGKWSLYRCGPWVPEKESAGQKMSLLEELAKRDTVAKIRRDALKEVGVLLELPKQQPPDIGSLSMSGTGSELVARAQPERSSEASRHTVDEDDSVPKGAIVSI
jgi:CRP-like cAMP-binding protein